MDTTRSDLSLTYDDVQIKPKLSDIEHRKDCNTITQVTKNVWLDIPLVSSPMDTVTDYEMCLEMDRLGGMGFLHRFNKSFEIANTIKDANKVTPFINDERGSIITLWLNNSSLSIFTVSLNIITAVITRTSKDKLWIK